MKLVQLGVACLNQTPLAWDGNFANIAEAIARARADGVTLLCLPELAITGYGCEDTFFMQGVQDLAFARTERVRGQVRLGEIRLDDGARDVRAQVDPARANLLDGLDQISRRLALQHVALHARAKRLGHVLRFVVPGEQDNLRQR